MKQFVKALNKEGACFKYIQEKFPYLNVEKVKEGVYVGSQIKKLTKDAQFLSSIYHDGCGKKSMAFLCRSTISKFLGNTKDSDYKAIVEICWLILKH